MKESLIKRFKRLFQCNVIIEERRSLKDRFNRIRSSGCCCSHEIYTDEEIKDEVAKMKI